MTSFVLIKNYMQSAYLFERKRKFMLAKASAEEQLKAKEGRIIFGSDFMPESLRVKAIVFSC